MVSDRHNIMFLAMKADVKGLQKFLDGMNEDNRNKVLNDFEDAADSVLMVAMNFTPESVREEVIEILLKAGADPEKLEKLDGKHNIRVTRSA